MLHFENDYNKGAHPALLEALVASNQEGLSGYGTDKYTESAIEKIRLATDCPHAQVTFLAGGTQTNQIVISSMLASYEGVIAFEDNYRADRCFLRWWDKTRCLDGGSFGIYKEQPA